jgi:tRNA A-37 threonylcarbamoyl transferase component Bud32
LKSKFGNVVSQLHQDGISFVDLTTLRDRFSAEQFQASKFDTHPSALAHHSIGESLADYILENHLMDAHE